MATVTGTIVNGDMLQLVATGVSVTDAGRIAQVIATMPDGRQFGAVVTAGIDGTLTADVPYEGPGVYTLEVFDRSSTTPLVSWTGQIPPDVGPPTHR
jgi:hypothetical protein